MFFVQPVRPQGIVEGRAKVAERVHNHVAVLGQAGNSVRIVAVQCDGWERCNGLGALTFAVGSFRRLVGAQSGLFHPVVLLLDVHFDGIPLHFCFDSGVLYSCLHDAVRDAFELCQPVDGLGHVPHELDG